MIIGCAQISAEVRRSSALPWFAPSPEFRVAVQTQRVHTGTMSATGPNAVSPQMRRAIRSAERAWRRIAAEFGLLTANQVTELLGREGQSIGEDEAIKVWIGGSLLYPGFQFDRETRSIHPVIKPLLALAKENGWPPRDVTYWMTSPSRWFADCLRPVDHLGDPDRVLKAAKDQFEDMW